MKNDLTIPWLTIWFEPVKTIDAVRNNEQYEVTLLIIFMFSTVMEFNAETAEPSLLILGLMFVYIFLFFVTALLLFGFGKLFKGKATYKEIVTAMTLGLIPSLFDYFSLLDYISDIGFFWWGLVVFVVMFSHIEGFSRWKAFPLFSIIVGAIMYLFCSMYISYSMYFI